MPDWETSLSFNYSSAWRPYELGMETPIAKKLCCSDIALPCFYCLFIVVFKIVHLDYYPIANNSKQYLSNNTEAALLAAAEHCRMPDASLLFSLIGIHRRPAIHIGIMSFMVGDFAFEIAVINRSC